jgi:hypothetical protein
MAREINLVPSSKFETIKAIRIRNFLLFLSIVVAGGAIGVVFVLGTILGGQNLALAGKDNMLGLYSEKINSYTELTDFLTIKDQLGKLHTLADNKNLFSRTFNLLSIFIPTNGDEVSFSKVDIAVNSDSIELAIDAQANSMNEPFIDYNVLDAFKKAMAYYRYDYGVYVNELGDTIPSYCIIESDDAGNMFNDDGKYYAYWTAKVDGCDPRHPIDLLEDEEEKSEKDLVSELNNLEDYDKDDLSNLSELLSDYSEEEIEALMNDDGEMRYDYTSYDGQDVVKIWRTPQFKEWYDAEYMALDGSISGIPHFESSCISYSGSLDDMTEEVYFSSSNDECSLIVDGVDGFSIIRSSNGRNQDRELILSFEGAIRVVPEYFKMQNTHMMPLGPNGRFNVTDSYTQVQSLFVPPADACEIDDIECRNGGK